MLTFAPERPQRLELAVSVSTQAKEFWLIDTSCGWQYKGRIPYNPWISAHVNWRRTVR